MSELYRAIGKSMAARYAVYALNLLSLMVLTRLFTPQIFGVIAAVQTIVVLFQLVAEGGFSPAIINLKALAPADRDGLFGLSLCIGLLFSVAIFFLGPALAAFYGIQQITQVSPYVAVALFGNTAMVLPLAMLQRQQAFFKVSIAGVQAELAALGVTVLAFLSKVPPLHAYALYFPTKALVNFGSTWFMTRGTDFGRPRPGARFSAVRPILRTTSFQFAFNFVNYFSRNLDNILVGKVLGASALGIYDRSYQLMRYPLMLLTFAMTPAIQPVLRDKTHDIHHVDRLHRDLAFKLALLGAAAAIGIFVLAKPIVLVMLGHQWLAIVPIVRLLAMIIPVQIVLSTSGSFFQAFNRTDLLFYAGIAAALINATAMFVGISHGSVAAMCWALFVSFHLNLLLSYFLMYRRIFNTGYLSFLASVWPVWLTAGALCALNVFL